MYSPSPAPSEHMCRRAAGGIGRSLDASMVKGKRNEAYLSNDPWRC
jgi:hypothetical protein